MARTYDEVRGPGGSATYTAQGNNTTTNGRGKVLVQNAYMASANRDAVPLLHTQLWVDTSFTRSTSIWIGGGVALPTAAGRNTPYNPN